MPTALAVGNTAFRAVSIEETHSKTDLDSLTVTRRGAASGLAAESALWTKGVAYPGYPNMALESKSITDRGPVSEIVLHFTGFISADTPENGLIDKQNDISLSSVSLQSDAGVDVQFQYFAQTTTYRWVHRGTIEPSMPRFYIPVPVSIPVGYLFAPFPARYDGSVSGEYQITGRLSQFSVTRLSPSMWAVSESWTVMVEPN